MNIFGTDMNSGMQSVEHFIVKLYSPSSKLSITYELRAEMFHTSDPEDIHTVLPSKLLDKQNSKIYQKKT